MLRSMFGLIFTWVSGHQRSAVDRSTSILARHAHNAGDPEVRRSSYRNPAAPFLLPPRTAYAVLDNDGTLWCEQPMYLQLAL